MTLEEAVRLILNEVQGKGARDPGWDGRMTGAILAVFGDGDATRGRQRLVLLAAAELVTKGHTLND